MKIGIITIPPTVNYGGILQAYALQKVLQDMGHQAHIICTTQRYPSLPRMKKPFVYAKRFIYKYLLGKKNTIIFLEDVYRSQICKNTEMFIQQHLHLKELFSFSDLREDDYDAYVAGSDQVWRSIYNGDIKACYFSFAEGWKVKRIAYAASFGTDKWEYSKSETRACKHLIQLFDAVSVREESALQLVNTYLGTTAKHVLDPTLLLDKQDYIVLFKDNQTLKSKGNMMCYILDSNDEIQKQIAELQSVYQLEVFHVYGCYSDLNSPLSDRIQPRVEQWLRGFYDARLVVTDSFHAVVFSVIFRKPFVLLGNASRGNARFVSLLHMLNFDLSDGMFNRLFVPEDSNYQALDRLRASSLHFLADSLR